MFKQTENQAYINCNINECQCYLSLSLQILRGQKIWKESLKSVTTEESFSASFHFCVVFQKFGILFLQSLSAGYFLLQAEYFLLVLKNNLYYLKMSEKKKVEMCLRTNDVTQLRNSGQLQCLPLENIQFLIFLDDHSSVHLALHRITCTTKKQVKQ